LRVPPDHTAGGADQAASRGLPFCKSLQAKVAFGCYLLGIIKLHGPKRTGRYTFPTPNAGFFIDEYQPLVISINGFDRAGVLTRRLGTVVTIDRDVQGAFFNYSD
jgi:hypothetical protein